MIGYARIEEYKKYFLLKCHGDAIYAGNFEGLLLELIDCFRPKERNSLIYALSYSIRAQTSKQRWTNTSESTYTGSPAQHSLTERYLRAIELLWHLSKDLYLPARVIANTLAMDDTRLNKGNSWKQMREYITQMTDAGFGRWTSDKHNYIVSDLGIAKIKHTQKVILSYLRPLSYSKEVIEKYANIASWVRYVSYSCWFQEWLWYVWGS